MKSAPKIHASSQSYANDVAQRAKDNIAYQKSRGISVGIPPFGTVRDHNGFLVPSPYGAWLSPDGQQMAHMLFEYLTCDLDQRRIVDFRLEPWADKYLIARSEWDVADENQNGLTIQEQDH